MWFIYALLGALGKSYSGLFRKKIAKSVSGPVYIWVGLTIILMIVTPFMWSQLSEIKSIFTRFPVLVLSAAATYLVATQLNLEALKREDLSYTAPLNAFVPVFTLAIALVFLNERPPAFGLVGLIAIVAGAYVVSLEPLRVNWYDPIKRILTSAGAQFSIGVALFYAINTVLLKILTNGGYNAIVVFYVTTLAGWLLLLYVPITKRAELRTIGASDKRAVIGGGLSAFASSFFHILAVANTFSSYAASVRRLDAVISVILGWKYLKEKNIRNKLIGSFVMTAGAIVMVLS